MEKQIEISKDNTIKIIFEKSFHCVIIPQKNNKNTLCISSQVGCSVGCEFCYTAKMGFMRNLTKDEIVNQFKISNNILEKKNQKITSIVFMGMGEPLLNLKNVILSLKELNQKYNFSLRKISISTSGFVKNLYKILEEIPGINIALSIHSFDELVRQKIMPTKKDELNDLIKFAKHYNSIKKHKIMIEYLMIENLTDRDKDIKLILDLQLEKNTYFNLIPLNGEMKIDNKTYKRSSKNRILFFKEKILEKGFKCFIRDTRGEDIDAACGMLNQK